MINSHIISSEWNRNKKKSKTGELIVEKYRGPNINPILIKQFPFETLNGINSTVARIQVFQKWKEIACWRQFLRQTSFEHMYGFAVKHINSFDSKKFKSNINLL